MCSVPNGDLPMTITWFLNGKSAVEYSGMSSTKLGKRSLVLSIESVGAEHSGNYTCLAKNIAGTTEYTTELKVYGT